MAAAAAGCGGGGGSSSSTAADWASGYCSGALTWVTTLAQQRAAVKTGSATAADAAQAVTNETNSFASAVDKLGTPETKEGETSQKEAQALAESLQGRIGRAAGAIETNNPDVSDAAKKQVVQTQLAGALGDMKTTTETLAQADPELGAAMKATPDCAKLNAALAGA